MSDDLVEQLRSYGVFIMDCSGCSPVALEAADRIQQLEADIERLERNAVSDAKWLATYHKWCEMNGCAPSSSDLSVARVELYGEEK